MVSLLKVGKYGIVTLIVIEVIIMEDRVTKMLLCLIWKKSSRLKGIFWVLLKDNMKEDLNLVKFSNLIVNLSIHLMEEIADSTKILITI